MVDFVREVETVSLHVQPLHDLGVVVAADVEITWHFINEYESAHLATLTVI